MRTARPKGYAVRNGTEIEAKSLVVSNLSALQSIRLIGEEHLDPNIVRRVKNIRHDRHNVVWGMIAMHELPRYKAVSFNPADCGKQPRMYIGPRNADYVANQYPAEIINNGIAKRAYMSVGPDSIWDRSRAPEGKHIIGFEEFSAPTRFFSPARWQALRNEFEDFVIRKWQRYTPNMTRNNIIASRIFTPYDIRLSHPNMEEGSIAGGDMIISQLDRFRPTPELSNYRTPIKNFYLCSFATHNGVGTGRWCSLNCYQVISEDYGLNK